LSAAKASIRTRFGAGAWITVIALVAGLLCGGFSVGTSLAAELSAVAGTVGGLWLDALKMVVIPLVVALLVKGVVSGASLAAEGRLTVRALAWFGGLYVLSAALGALLMPGLLAIYPLSPEAAGAIRAGFSAVDPASVRGSVASVSDFIRSFIPSNPFAAAAEGSILQIVVFTLAFAVALATLDEARRAPVVGFFNGVCDALLIVIGWVLQLAPLGVFSLAFVAGAASGAGLFGAVLHFIILYVAVALVVLVLAYAVALAAAGFALPAFAKAMAPTQAIAFSTQSSTGSLPAMLVSARELGVSDRSIDIVLPMAAALFRVTGPAMNIAVVIFVATTLGMPLGAGAYVAGIAIASVASISAPGLPGQVSYFTSIAPISMAMGVPIAPLGMLIAVEPVPDMFRTVGNVTMDVAVAGAVDRAARRKAAGS
jgi:Na+/H+-dicarboxylate symporter